MQSIDCVNIDLNSTTNPETCGVNDYSLLDPVDQIFRLLLVVILAEKT